MLIKGDPALALALEVLRRQLRGERQAHAFSRAPDLWRNPNEIAGLENRLGCSSNTAWLLPTTHRAVRAGWHANQSTLRTVDRGESRSPDPGWFAICILIRREKWNPT